VEEDLEPVNKSEGKGRERKGPETKQGGAMIGSLTKSSKMGSMIGSLTQSIIEEGY
jgi:hypothetical protein